MEVGLAWDQALSCARPLALEAVTHPSMMKCDPDAGDMNRRSFRDLVRSYVTR